MGVKSLWKLVGPVGRPVMLETLEGQTLAIDSSIWIYQFQATMRDKDGKALSNAHVLGFLRRIAKLLFYGIKPVFVFDGGAPALKRNTLNERKQKKSGAATSHAKLAEKLLAAQMRREAVKQVKAKQKQRPTNSKVPSGPVVLDDNTVYLEDIDGSAPKSRATNSSPAKPSMASPAKPRFYDHDPYRLPDVDLEANIAKATRAVVPDPRLATEDELRAFIEDMRPEDFDVTSPAFRELPTEIQYEIVGDLRLKSRQTSFARLQNMLQKSHTPLDFSKQQILNLRQRNTLTQQLLTTTDSIGKAHLTIPVRIASERNREYLLIKNEGQDGGWILGIRDDGTKEKPIEIDQDDNVKAVNNTVLEEDSEDDMEEVAIPVAGVPDADLQEYQRSLALEAIAKRQPHTKQTRQRPPKQPLFDPEDDPALNPFSMLVDDDEDDEQLAFAIQESLDQAQTALPIVHRPNRVNAIASSSKSTLDEIPNIQRVSSGSSHNPHRSLDDEFMHGNRLETALSIANAGPVRTPVTAATRNPIPNSPTPSTNTQIKAVATPTRDSQSNFGQPALLLSDTKIPAKSWDSSFGTPTLLSTNSPAIEPTALPAQSPVQKILAPPPPQPRPISAPLRYIEPINSLISPMVSGHSELSGSEEEMDEVLIMNDNSEIPLQPTDGSDGPKMLEEGSEPVAVVSDEIMVDIVPPQDGVEQSDQQVGSLRPLDSGLSPPASPPTSHVDLADVEEPISDWSRSPSPIHVPGIDVLPPRAPSPVHDNWDAAHEMDPVAEESGFAEFMSQVQGKNLDDVQKEIDEEIHVLNVQKRAALRDSDDINQQMVSQIMMLLNLFGIPYITAPMEAEAQCAELVQLGLVDGVITDDSDVFLFGGLRVYKNMFNQSKTVECFLMSDLSRELGLERDALIRLAYLLGSDYVEGLQGVGPVVAMELLGEFPGNDGLHKFKDWWTKVQSGKDKAEDTHSKFRKRFKKKFKSLYLPPEWPNPLVRDAYYHPTVDESEERFKWGLPDLDALRDFLRGELSWGTEKVDQLLLPIIQKMRKRSQDGALNKQGNLNGYFDVAGSGTVAPKKRQAYASKRLQQVVSDMRKKRKRSSQSPAVDEDHESTGTEADDPPVKKRAAKGGKGKAATKAKSKVSATRGGKSQSGSRSRAKKSGADQEEEEEGSEFEGMVDDSPAAEPPQLRPRPKPKPTFRANTVSVTVDNTA
ncbi:hypothetical protein MIND_00253600 [Mycena indigotica]|uniref:PIN domain-like protein n=1 Tax=Mycena indigotica TaxID=2126181 RepID=A0A8H6T9H6_9AGAR|nr:uncharacterized protein MIND_00253600 [Mycena indigotica]KAF7312402.1 hypothetical protein MIND_00253600 [Mycena indigotica]